MSTDALYPFAGNHAIQSLAFVFEWASPLSVHQLQEIKKLRAEFLGAFPVMQELQTLTFTVGPAPALSQVPSNPGGVGGIHFRGPITPSGLPAQEIQVNLPNCVVIINQYTRWAEVWGNVKKWIAVISPKILPAHPISAIGLQCVDVFHWRANPDSIVLSEIFKESDYLPKHVFKCKSLWHSHHGFFEDIIDPVGYKLLENVNVGMIENDKQRSITIQCVHRAEMASQIWDGANFTEVTEQLFPHLHERNKGILKSLLTKSVCEKIKLA